MAEHHAAPTEDSDAGGLHRLTLSLIEGTLAVECEDASVLAWLREMTTPAFDLATSGDPFASVIVKPRCRSGLALLADRREPCFALDAKALAFPARTVGTTRTVHDRDTGAVYLIGSKRVEIGPLGPSPGLRIAAFRVVRELAVARAMATPRLQLHAAGIESDGRVVLLAGPSGAGKTTTLAHLAASTRASIVANDRAIVSHTDGAWEVRGVPTIVVVRPDTVASLPRVFDGRPYDERTVHLSLEELPNSSAADRQRKFHWRPAMSMAQLAAAVGVPLAAGGRLASIALLQMDEAVTTFAVRPLPLDEAERRLQLVRFGMVTEPRPPTVFETMLGWNEVPAYDSSLARLLVGEVPCVEVRIGSGLLASQNAGAELLAALLDPVLG
jgi:hypothetical protein